MLKRYVDTSEGPQDEVSDELGENEKHEIKTLLCEYSDVLTDSSGLVIRLNIDKPIRTKLFPLPFMSRETVCEEVRRMLETGVIEPSSSPFSSPIVIVK